MPQIMDVLVRLGLVDRTARPLKEASKNLRMVGVEAGTRARQQMIRFSEAIRPVEQGLREAGVPLRGFADQLAAQAQRGTVSERTLESLTSAMAAQRGELGRIIDRARKAGQETVSFTRMTKAGAVTTQVSVAQLERYQKILDGISRVLPRTADKIREADRTTRLYGKDAEMFGIVQGPLMFASLRGLGSAAHGAMLAMGALRGNILQMAFSIIFLRFSIVKTVAAFATMFIGIGLIYKALTGAIRAMLTFGKTTREGIRLEMQTWRLSRAWEALWKLVGPIFIREVALPLVRALTDLVVGVRRWLEENRELLNVLGRLFRILGRVLTFLIGTKAGLAILITTIGYLTAAFVTLSTVLMVKVVRSALATIAAFTGVRISARAMWAAILGPIGLVISFVGVVMTLTRQTEALGKVFEAMGQGGILEDFAAAGRLAGRSLSYVADETRKLMRWQVALDMRRRADEWTEFTEKGVGGLARAAEVEGQQSLSFFQKVWKWLRDIGLLRKSWTVSVSTVGREDVEELRTSIEQVKSKTVTVTVETNVEEVSAKIRRAMEEFDRAMALARAAAGIILKPPPPGRYLGPTGPTVWVLRQPMRRPPISLEPIWEWARLQRGALVTRPTLALVGERGPEAIIPLRRVRGLGPSIVVNVSGNYILDSATASELADTIASRILREVRLKSPYTAPF